MSKSYIMDSEPIPDRATLGKRCVLITGAAGRIGRPLVELVHERYDLRLIVRREKDRADLEPFGKVVVGDISRDGTIRNACEDIDTVVHLAADPSAHASWESLHPNNIVAAYNTFQAAVEARCRRIVFASSVHAVSGYPKGYQVHSEDPVNPGDLYGVSKCFGEAMARYVAVQKGLSAIVLRIGAYQSRDEARKSGKVGMMGLFLSHRDTNQLICRAIEDNRLRFAIVHALSDNLFNRMDITEARELLNYDPQDDFTQMNPRVSDLNLERNVQPHDSRHT